MRFRISGVFALTAMAISAQDRLTLREAEELALKHNPQVEAARLTAEAAGYGPVLARSPLQPQLTAGLQGLGTQENSRLTGGGFTNPLLISRIGFGVGLNQLLTDFGRTRLLEQSAVNRAKAESSYAIGVRAVTVLSVRQAYFAALRAQAVLRVAEETVRARTLVVEQVRALADAKLRSGLDLSFVEVGLSEALLVRASVQNEREAALADLSNAMGLQSPKEFELIYEAPALDGLESNTELRAEAAGNRPDLIARRLEATAAAQLAQAEQKLDRPTVSATGAAGYSPVHTKQLLRDEYIAGGVSITVPILNGGAFKARQAEALVRSHAAESRVRELENRVARDISVTQLNMRTAKQRIELTGQLLMQAGQALELAQARYDLGLSSIVELSQAQLTKLQAEIQGAAAAFDYQVQHSLLEFHVGRLR
jgi:outer membrane protein